MFSLFYIIAIIGIIIQGLFIYFERKEKYVLAVIFKGLASLAFVTLGIIFVIKGSPDKLVLAGLILGLFGDVCLNLRYVFKKYDSKIFLLGVACFLSGHILYLIAIINSNTPILYSIPAGIIIAALILYIIFTTLKVKLSYKIFGVLYIGAIVLMTSMAIGNFIVVLVDNSSNILITKYLLYAIGAILFTISDIVLIFNSFGPKPKFSLRITNLSLYYLGQLFIAASMFYYLAINCN